jgi:hypothetical protein
VDSVSDHRRHPHCRDRQRGFTSSFRLAHWPAHYQNVPSTFAFRALRVERNPDCAAILAGKPIIRHDRRGVSGSLMPWTGKDGRS